MFDRFLFLLFIYEVLSQMQFIHDLIILSVHGA